MNKIEFVRGQGGLIKTLPGEDHISGFLTWLPDASLPVAQVGEKGFSTDNRMMAISTLERAESMGITDSSADWAIQVLHYHLSEIFRINPAISLYVGLFAKPESDYDFREVKQLQNFAGGKLRQMAVYAADRELTVWHPISQLLHESCCLQTICN